MALTPINYAIDEELAEETTETTETEIQPSRTLFLDLENGKLGGYIDEKQAIQQFIRKSVYTARNRYLIYSDAYGSEVEDLISQSLPFSVLKIEIPRLIEDAIIYDDRIESVDNFVLTQDSDNLFVSFTVTLTNGESIASEVIL